jgi:hypothetical protein
VAPFYLTPFYHEKQIFDWYFHAQPVHLILKFLDEKTILKKEIFIILRLPIRLFLKSLFNYFIAC